MRRISHRLIVTVLSVLGAGALAQSTSNSSDENKEMERQAAFIGLTRDLHTSNQNFEDGTKGSLIALGLPDPDPREIYPSPPYKSREEVQLHKKFCNSDLIVVATEVGSHAFLTSNKALIYTEYNFRVTQILRSAPGVSVGQLINDIQIGGTVTDAGEKLRMEAGTPPIVQNREYLLFLRHPPLSSTLFILDDHRVIFPVVSGRLYFMRSEYQDTLTQPFVPGETVRSVVSRISRVMAKAPCSQ